MDAMVDPRSSNAQPDEVGRQLDKTAADLRTLAEQLGAIPDGSPRAISPRRAKITFAVVVALAVLGSWFVWAHWHSLLAAAAPLIWIFVHAWRWRSRTSQGDRRSFT